MSENTICTDLYLDYVTEKRCAHLKEILRIANTINTVVAEGKIVTVDCSCTGGIRIDAAFLIYNEVVCVKHCSYHSNTSPEIPVYRLCSGDMVWARHRYNDKVDVLCGKYIKNDDRSLLQRLME